MKKLDLNQISYKIQKYGHHCTWDFASAFNKYEWQGTLVEYYAYVICHDCGKVKEVKIENEFSKEDKKS